MNTTTNTTADNAPAATALIERMKTFQGNYDGYPTMTCSDDGLIEEALAEGRKFDADLEQIGMLTYLASEACTTREEYANAKAFILAAVESAWECNMSEGQNEIHAEVAEEEWAESQQ